MALVVAGYVAMFFAGGIAVTVAALLILEQRSKGSPLAVGDEVKKPVESFDEWLDRQW